MKNRTTPSHWSWAYHVTPKELLPAIRETGLAPNWHPHVEDAPVLFVEPDLDGLSPYHHPGKTVVLRFKTPGFGTTEDGEAVIYGGSMRPGGPPEAPFVGAPGEDGVIPRERLQVLRGKQFQWLVD